jgi:hypothetical protein
MVELQYEVMSESEVPNEYQNIKTLFFVIGLFFFTSS